MQQFVIKIPKRVRRIESQIIETPKTDAPKDGQPARPQNAESLIEAQKVKILKDRIRVLELELQQQFQPELDPTLTLIL